MNTEHRREIRILDVEILFEVQAARELRYINLLSQRKTKTVVEGDFDAEQLRVELLNGFYRGRGAKTRASHGRKSLLDFGRCLCDPY
jgi:hypothetical protein